MAWNDIGHWLTGGLTTSKGRDFLFGSEDKFKKLPTGTAQQTQFGGKDLIGLLQRMMQNGGGLDLANQYDQGLLGQGPEAFNNFSAPYLQEFEQQILPQIAERFAGMGALSSSGFGQALGGSASNLQAKLAQLFSELQAQAVGRQQGQFQNLSQIGLGYSPFAYTKKPGSQGLFGSILQGGAKEGGSGAASSIASLFL
jgi:hypothetical protein